MAIHRYKTRYGTIFHADRCKDDFGNIITARIKGRTFTGNKVTATYTLQRPAIRSLRAVARDLGSALRPRPVIVTGTIRACETQAALYKSDPNRYAHPNSTLHTQGLAIDVHTGHLNNKVRESLLRHGWHQSRPVDEPWHFSFRLTA